MADRPPREGSAIDRNEAASRDVDLDLAVVGAGVAGTFVAESMARARPEWAIGLFERTDRIGGRLRSVAVEGLDHPIELGAMRFLTSHDRVTSIVERFGLATHPFDSTGGGPDRSYLRGVVGRGLDDTEAGSAYPLGPGQRSRSAVDLAMSAFERIVPGFQDLQHDDFARWRATGRFIHRPVTDWPIGEALVAIHGSDAYDFVKDAFGYDSGMRAFCAPDFIEFLFAGGDPRAQARTPDDGMDSLAGAIAQSFASAGGAVHLEHEATAVAIENGSAVLRFADGRLVRASRVVLATPVPATRLLLSTSPVLAGAAFNRVLDSVEAFPAMKLYLWYDRPWWRPTVPGVRSTTDLPLRKTFYLDGGAGSWSALLAMYSDGLDVRSWVPLYDGGAAGAPAPPAMLEELQRQLAASHPEVGEIPTPLGSALMYWGADPHETGWHFWRAGDNSDEILDLAPQPERDLPIYLANEAFSRHQSWVEGALESAEAVVGRLTAGGRTTPARR
jgi:monoamine oxidase